MKLDDRKIIHRAMARRGTETILLIIGIALGIGAAVIGITLISQSTAEMNKTLQKPEFRTIVVHTEMYSKETPLMGMKEDNEQIMLTPVDLEARNEAPDVDYGFVMNYWGMKFGAKGNDGKRIAGRTKEETEGPQPVLDWLRGFQVSPEFFAMMKVQAAEGSLFTEADMTSGEKLLILGSELGKTLYADGLALGRRVTSWDGIYTISGILEPTGNEEYDMAGFTQPPGMEFYEKMAGLRGNKDGATVNIGFGVEDSKDFNQAKIQLESWFNRKYGEGNVKIEVPREEVEASQMRNSRLVIIILFSRAMRRQKSVGILMALGSTRRNIFNLFFSEALIIGGIGAVLGTGFSLAVLPALNKSLMIESLSPFYLVLGVVSAWLITMGLTVFPAVQASKVPAAEAMRNE
ncbi:hypothetical protein ES703_37025 [subsurface metagenome]